MQSDEIGIVAALTSLLKTLCEMEKLASKPINQWATYSTTCAKLVKEASGSAGTIEYYYQAQKIKYVTGFEKPGFHTRNIKLTISPKMDYWLNTLSHSTAGLALKPRDWFLWQLFLDPV